MEYCALPELHPAFAGLDVLFLLRPTFPELRPIFCSESPRAKALGFSVRPFHGQEPRLRPAAANRWSVRTRLS
jgi:hypothetical protein